MNEIVAACQYQDQIIIFTRTGEIYSMKLDYMVHMTCSMIMELFRP